MKYVFFICILFYLPCIVAAQNCQLNPPVNLTVSDIASCSAVLHWTSNTTVKKYVVSYKKSNSSEWSANIKAGTNTSYEFTGLLPNTKYDFSVKSQCSDGTSSKKVKASATTQKCSAPDEVKLEALNNHAAEITVTSDCPYDSLYIKYSAIGGAPHVISRPAASSYIVDGLNSDSIYLFRFSTCPKSMNQWTATDTLFLESQPNIILILLDDSRYDYFGCNGAPSFVQTPNIDRIANEGVNFKKAYVATSLCAPSRATIATGLFTLKTGVTTNGHVLNQSFETVPEVLGDNGYYTALVGKNHHTFLKGDEPEFNYFLESVGFEESDGTQYNYNGSPKFIFKAAELTFTDTAIALINRIDDPLLIWLAYRVPHLPLDPLPAFEGDYDGFPIPWKPDTAQYKVNFPSYLYKGVGEDYGVLHGYTLDTTYRDALESIKGLDSCIGKIFEALENQDKLDNTLLIFMSDNGFMMGSHWLQGKTHAYEPSMRTPLFLRYPKWFPEHSVVTSQFATNMDIAPTIYQAAGIDFDGPMDGHSLKSLFDGDFKRQELYYLMLHNPSAGAPTKRAIRDQYYKYIHYSCNSDTVEEFFDMIHDSLEITNLINNSAYQEVIEKYRHKYDSIRVAWQDTDEGSIKDCYIENPSPLKQYLDDKEELPAMPMVYPTLCTGHAEIFQPWTEAEIKVYDHFGRLLQKWKTSEEISGIDLHEFVDGVYLVNISYGENSVTRKLVLTRN